MTTDVSQPGGAQDRVADGVGTDVGVGVTEEAVALELDAPEDQLSPGGEGVDVVAHAHRHGGLDDRPGPGQVLGPRDLEVGRLARDQNHRLPESLHQLALVGGLGGRGPAASKAPRRIEVRNPCGVCASQTDRRLRVSSTSRPNPLKRPELFSLYYAGSPSIRYDKGVLYTYEKEYAATHSDLNATLFMTAGGAEDSVMIANVNIMAAQLKARNYPGLKVETTVFPDETHMLCVPAAWMRAFSVLYKK